LLNEGGDTDESLWGFGAFSSRQAVIGGGAARLAGEAVRDRALRLAAGMLDAKADELTLSGGQIYVNGDERPPLSLAEVGRVAYLESNRLPAGMEPGLEETRFYDPIRGAFTAGASRAWPRMTANCTRCSGRSPTATGCSAASARRGS